MPGKYESMILMNTPRIGVAVDEQPWIGKYESTM